jgi:sulfur transfer complex TusBCD TusB component (DsrH family)
MMWKRYMLIIFSLSFLPKQDLEFLKSEIYTVSEKFDPNLSYENAVIKLMKKSTYLKHIIDSKLNYYIIETQNDVVIGPLNLQEFRNECKSRNLSNIQF